jgi:hypothetical protein
MSSTFQAVIRGPSLTPFGNRPARILTPINEQLQEFKRSFHHAWRVATTAADEK